MMYNLFTIASLAMAQGNIPYVISKMLSYENYYDQIIDGDGVDRGSLCADLIRASFDELYRSIGSTEEFEDAKLTSPWMFEKFCSPVGTAIETETPIWASLPLTMIFETVDAARETISDLPLNEDTVFVLTQDPVLPTDTIESNSSVVQFTDGDGDDDLVLQAAAETPSPDDDAVYNIIAVEPTFEYQRDAIPEQADSLAKFIAIVESVVKLSDSATTTSSTWTFPDDFIDEPIALDGTDEPADPEELQSSDSTEVAEAISTVVQIDDSDALTFVFVEETTNNPDDDQQQSFTFSDENLLKFFPDGIDLSTLTSDGIVGNQDTSEVTISPEALKEFLNLLIQQRQLKNQVAAQSNEDTVDISSQSTSTTANTTTTRANDGFLAARK